MDIAKAFQFVFEDEEWVSKILLGGLISLIPVIGQLAVLGYALKVAQNVTQGNPRPLPAWNEFGEHLMRGLYEFVIRLVYSLPIVVVGLLIACGLAFTGGAVSRQGNAERVGALFGTIGLCLIPLLFILGLAIVLVTFAAIARFVATNSLGEALKVGQVIAAVRSSIGAWVILLLVGLLASVIGGLGAIACGVGVFFTAFYAQCVIGHALGQTVVQLGLASGAASPLSYGPPPAYQ